MRQAPQIGEQLRNWGDISRLHPSPSKGNESWGYNMFLVLPQQTAWWGATPRNYQVTNPATADGWKMLERSRHLSGALFDCRGYCIIPFEEVSYFQEENAAWRNAQSITKHLQSHQKNALPGGLYHPVAEQARQQDNKKTASHKQRERERERGVMALRDFATKMHIEEPLQFPSNLVPKLGLRHWGMNDRTGDLTF